MPAPKNESEILASGYTKLSDGSFKRLKRPDIGGLATIDTMFKESKQKRIRQSGNPLMNKLESEWLSVLQITWPNSGFRAQARNYRLGNGVWYKPDFVGFINPGDGSIQETAWEVKGKQAWDDAIVKLKVAAASWQEVDWYLVWKDTSGVWQQQRVLP